jgi:hypothetical protein
MVINTSAQFLLHTEELVTSLFQDRQQEAKII